MASAGTTLALSKPAPEPPPSLPPQPASSTATNTARSVRRRRRVISAIVLPAVVGAAACRLEPPYSSVGSRRMSPAMSSSTGTPSRTRHTASVSGSSTPSRWERSRRTGAVVSPSTTWPISAAASSAVRPRAMSSPARRLRPARVPARDDQVAHSGQPRERVRVGARLLPEPRHLREAAGDERRLGVVAEAQAVDAAGGEGDDVLRRRAELDTERVVVHVDTEDGRVQRLLHAQGERLVLAGHHRRRGQPRCDLLGHVRARENRDGTVADEQREALARGRVEALREAQQRRVAGEAAGDLGEDAARDGDGERVDSVPRRIRDEGGVDAVERDPR